MEKSVIKYVLRYSVRQQITLTVLAAASFPFLYLFYELPKQIINEAIGGRSISFPYELVDGIELDQVTFLFVLCGAFLVLVIINQTFKYIINVYKGLTGERMLRRLRFDLYARILRFPLPTFRKMSQGEIIPMITQEVEPLGGFIGDAFSQPAFQGGTLLTILGFLFYQDWRMAAAAVMLYPLQVWLIPKLQRRVNLLGKERVRRVRRLSDRIGETVQGVQEIHAHDTARLNLTNFASQLDSIFHVRYQIYRKKFVIKFLNNFIQQLGPFFFYSIGGYFVITGELEIGTLVAAIAAHKDLASPWKELLAYYQQYADASIKYEQVINQFEPHGMRDSDYQMKEPDAMPVLEGEVAAANLTLRDEQEVAVVDGASFRLSLDRSLAVVGAPGSGREELALMLARLIDPDRGSVAVGGVDLAEAPEAVTGRRLAYLGQSSFVFAGTIGSNLYFGLKHRPMTEPEYHGAEASARSRYVGEAERSGNITFDTGAEWIDYASAGATGPADLATRALEALGLVGMTDEIYQFGLRGTIDPEKRADLAELILNARARLRERLQDPEVAPLVEIFDRERYNTNASVGENLLFGNPVGEAFDADRLADNAYVLAVLERAELIDDFLQLGYQLAATMVELFSDLPPDHELFQQFSFVSAEDLPEVQALLQRADRDNLGALVAADRGRLISLPFMVVPARHRLGLIDEAVQAQILKAREIFAAELPEDLTGAVEFFDIEQYNRAANLQDNILFGKVAYGQAHAQDRVGELIGEVIEEMGLRDTVAEVGLEYDVGIAGARLSSSQRQRLALARALLKRPGVLLMFESTASLDSNSQARIMNGLLEAFRGRCLIWAVHRADMAERFDEVLVMRQGRIVEQGTFAELSQDETYFHELLNGD
jgi:ABC-type multidrug transport system fused ATPase/permease subunit